MQATDYQVFVTMYHALDAAYDENHSDKVLSFIGDADPYIWKGHVSGDPAVFSEFSKTFAKRFPSGRAAPEEAAEYVRSYLTEQNAKYSWVEGDLVAAFDSVATPELWKQALEEAEK